MKTAIFINTFAKMKNYDMEDLIGQDIRLVAIVSSKDFPDFKEKYSGYFNNICLSIACDHGEFGDLNYAYSSKVVANELSINKDVRIICQSEDNLLLAGKLRDSFKLPGMGYQEILPFRDKVLMKNIIENAGLRVPKYTKLQFNQKEDLKQKFVSLSDELGLPFLLKPISALGSVGIQIINNEEEFQKHYGIIQSIEYEAEEFISGTLYHCDSIIKNGKTLFVVCCQYSNPNFDFQLGKSIISLPLKSDDTLAQRIFEFSATTLNAMGFYNGISHLEIFLTETNELIFLEVAARSPGVVTPMYRQAFNVPFEDFAFKIEMGIDFEIPKPSDTFYMSGILPTIKGKIHSLINPEIFSEYFINWSVKPGDYINTSSSLREQSGTILVWNQDYELLVRDFSSLKNFTSLELA